VRKTYFALGAAMALAFSHIATATVWTDNVSNSFTFNPGKDNSYYSFIYDITGSGDPLNILADPSNAFNPGEDIIDSAFLTLDFSLGNGTPIKTANIALDFGSQIQLAYSIADETLTLATAIGKLNADGTLKLEIERTAGTFTLTSSTLTATGTDNTLAVISAAPTSVPEPGSLALFGMGMISLAFIGRRRLCA